MGKHLESFIIDRLHFKTLRLIWFILHRCIYTRTSYAQQMGEIFLALRIILDMLTQSIIHHLNAEKTGEGGNQRKNFAQGIQKCTFDDNAHKNVW